MTTGQTMMVIFAFVVLTTTLLSFNSRSTRSEAFMAALLEWMDPPGNRAFM